MHRPVNHLPPRPSRRIAKNLYSIFAILTVCTLGLPTQARALDALPALQEQDPDILLKERPRDMPDWATDNFKRRDAGLDGWRTEVLHGSAKGQLKKVIAYLLGAATESENQALGLDLQSALDPNFACLTELRPAQLQMVYQDGTTRNWRAASIASGLYQQEDLAILSGALIEPFASASEIHPFFKFINVDLLEDGGFQTNALVHFSAHTADGLVQSNSKWACEWSIGLTDEDVKLRSLKLLEYEEAITPKALFGDISSHVFGRLPFWRNEFLRGVDDYQNKVDRLFGQAFVGSQGFAVGDINGDGLDDIYVTQQGGLPNRMFLHNADGTTTDYTRRSNLGILETSRSALFVDLDNDGDQDVAIAIGQNILVAYNDGRGTFGQFTPLNGTGIEDIYSMSAADADGDGDLDLYACRYVANGLVGGVPTPYHDANNGASNFFWRNDGIGKFTDATVESGLDSNNSKFSLASIWLDFDLDGDLDLYVANDFGQNNLFVNENGKFRDMAAQAGVSDRAAGMGLSCADFDRDGDLDILVTNMFSSAGLRIAPQQQFQGDAHQKTQSHYVRHARGNTLLSSNGDGTYQDVTVANRVAVAGWSWGSKFVDFNNDGYPDIYSPNGFLTGKDKDDL
jgi:VCBS repeat protein